MCVSSGVTITGRGGVVWLVVTDAVVGATHSLKCGVWVTDATWPHYRDTTGGVNCMVMCGDKLISGSTTGQLKSGMSPGRRAFTRWSVRMMVSV